MCRYVLATQLGAHRRVIDYRAAEPMRQELLGYAQPEWVWWRDTFEPRMEALHEVLRTACRRDDAVGA